MRIFAGFKQRGQKGVFAAEAHQEQQVGPIQHRNEARLHRHAMRIFDAGSQAVDVNAVTADLACEVGQIGEGRDHANFGRAGWHRAKRGDGNKRQGQGA